MGFAPCKGPGSFSLTGRFCLRSGCLTLTAPEHLVLPLTLGSHPSY